MRKLKVLLLAVVAVALLTPLPATAQAESPGWHDVNAPPGYCGHSLVDFENTGTTSTAKQSVDADVIATSVAHAPCDWSGSILSLPANNLQVAISIRCKISSGATEFEGFGSVFVSNPAGLGDANAWYPATKTCGNGIGAGYPWARVVVSAKYYLFPGGWTTVYLHTTHWCSTDAGNPCTH